MNEEEKNEISNQTTDQKSEKRKKKKRRGKTSTTENNDQSGPTLPTVTKIISGEEDKLPIDEYPYKANDINNQRERKVPQGSTRLRARRKERNEGENPKDPKEELNPKEELKRSVPPLSKDMKTMKEQIIFNDEEPLEKNINQIDEKEKKVLRSNMNKYFKRANIVDKQQSPYLKEESKGTIPSKDINPNDLFVVDEDDGEIDYLEAQKAYELSVFLDSHNFIKKNNNFEKRFVDLVKRKIIRFERNLLDLVENDKFFILYELQVSEHTDLCLTEIVTLNAIKSVFLAYSSVHLIIIVSDEELSNKDSKKYDNSLIKQFAQEKLAYILIYLDLDSNNEKRVHAFSAKEFKLKNEEFSNEKKQLRELINKPKLRKLFNLTKKEEERNDLLLDYPCSLAIATNPLIYSNYIPEITQDFRCLIINSIFFMNRYQLCFDAAKLLSFNEPAVIALKIVPPLKGVNGLEAFSNLEEDNTILSSDEDISLSKKINDLAYGEEEKRNPNLDIGCQYLAFLEEDNDNYNDAIKRFEEGKVDKAEIRLKVFNLLKDIFKIFREKDLNNIDINKVMIK